MRVVILEVSQALWPLAIPLIGAAASAFGAKRQNDRAEDAANAQMAFQTESNQKQMDFQERMSSTAHQREVQDLMKAGLNPMLSAMGGSGASSPSGASSAGAAPPVQNELSGSVTSALQAANIRAQNTLLGAQANQANASAELQRASAVIPGTVGGVIGDIKGWLSKQTGPGGIGSLLDSAQGGVTNVLEGTAGALAAGKGVLRRGYEGLQNSAASAGRRIESVGASGVELLQRVDQLIEEANRKFLERQRSNR